MSAIPVLSVSVWVSSTITVSAGREKQCLDYSHVQPRKMQITWKTLSLMRASGMGFVSVLLGSLYRLPYLSPSRAVVFTVFRWNQIHRETRLPGLLRLYCGCLPKSECNSLRRMLSGTTFVSRFLSCPVSGGYDSWPRCGILSATELNAGGQQRRE